MKIFKNFLKPNLRSGLVAGFLFLFAASFFANVVPIFRAETPHVDDVAPSFLLGDVLYDGKINAWYIPRDPRITSPIYLDLVLPGVLLLIFWAMKPPRTAKRLLVRTLLISLVSLALFPIPFMIWLYGSFPALPRFYDFVPPPPFLESETKPWETYRNEEYGFELKYPSDLTPQVTSSVNPAAGPMTEIVFRGERYGYNMLRITIYDISPFRTIEEWAKDQEERNRVETLINYEDMSIKGLYSTAGVLDLCFGI